MLPLLFHQGNENFNIELIASKTRASPVSLNEVKDLLHLNEEILRCALLDFQETTRNKFMESWWFVFKFGWLDLTGFQNLSGLRRQTLCGLLKWTISYKNSNTFLMTSSVWMPSPSPSKFKMIRCRNAGRATDRTSSKATL